MKKLGLLGKNISYSFSKSYFENKFKNENINDITYENFDINAIDLFPEILKNTKNLKGLALPFHIKKRLFLISIS